MKKGIKFILMVGMLAFLVTANWAQDEFKPDINFKGSRFVAGYIDSENDGSFPAGSFQMPDAKLRFNWSMAPEVIVVTRLSMSNAGAATPDYFYLEYKNLLATASPIFKDSVFNPTIRLGRMKLDIGEETWSDNAVESVVVSNSVSNVTGYDEGLQLFGTLPKEKVGVPMKWSLSLTNGNAGSGADNEQAKGLCFKIGANPIPELYVSASHYNSGQLGDAGSGTQAAEVKYANTSTAPTNSTEWNRTIQEFNLRYDFQPGKENRLNPGAPAWSDSKAFVRLAYGQFADDGKDTKAPILQVTDREGKYYFVEGCYNATEKIYLGTRYSNIAFDKNTIFSSLQGVTANEYTRISAGAGYRLTGNTHVKFEVATNTEDVDDPATALKEKAPKNNLFSLLFTTKF